MDIKRFLEKFVQGYLFADLDNMEKIRESDVGNCGYPMVISILAGIELLGTLTYPHTLSFDKDNAVECDVNKTDAEVGKPQFDWYWKHFLAPMDGRYRIKGQVSGLIRSLLRDGLAHVFLVKPGIEVTKFQPERHMKSSATSWLIIDSTTFAEDFKQSYWRYVRPILDGQPAIIKGYSISVLTMQERLNELDSAYTREAKNAFVDLAGKIPIVPGTQSIDTTGSFNFPPPGTIITTDKGSKPPS